MEKTITIDGKKYKMRASALTPRLYRYHIGRDIVKDMVELEKAYKRALEGMSKDMSEEDRKRAQLSATDLTIFENVAWIFMKQAGEDVGNSPDEWLDSFDGVFSVYEVFPAVAELWNLNTASTSVPRKK